MILCTLHVPMSTSSKSEEYRDRCWQDVYTGVHDDYFYNEGRTQSENRNTNSYYRARRFPHQSYNHASNNHLYEISHLPPPLEPRERLVPCVDPVTAELSVIPNWWKSKVLRCEGGAGDAKECSHTRPSTSLMMKRESNYNYGSGISGKVNDSYIMPSSLTPVSHASDPRPGTYIPPPTPFRDEICTQVNKCFSYSDEDNGHRNENTCGSACEIIEIKRPGTVCLHRKDSDYGLAYQYKPVSHNGYHYGVSSDPRLSSTFETTSYQNGEVGIPNHGPNGYSRFTSGIFNLPEVYSPPPLAPTSQQISVPSTNSSQLHGLMPSFFENTGSSEKKPNFHISPRLVYSEPILKSGVDKNSFTQSRPVTATHLSPRMRNKTFCISTTNNGNDARRNGVVGESVVAQTYSDQRLLKHGTTQNFHTDDAHFLEPDHEKCPRRVKNGGSGDGESTQCSKETERKENSKHTNFSIHTCLSPRARIPRLQPSVITPAITESLMCECLSNLKSAHWEDNFEAFSQIYNLTEMHPGKVKSVLNKVIWHGLPHLSSPRTKLARMACICFKRLFQTQKRSMETEGEKVFYRLLDLCGGLANNFIQQESREALVAAVENMDPLKSLTFLELHGAKHKNPHVREFSAYLLNAIMDELPQNKLMNKEFSPRIIPMTVSFLREGLLQTRLHAKLALDKIFDHPTFDSKLRRYVSPENVRHIADTLREFRVRAF